MFEAPIFAPDDVEMDVRERLVTPLLAELGYAPDEIHRERAVTIASSKPVFADYFIETDPENPFELPTNRIIIEAKRPSSTLSAEVLDQAVSYASHRLIEANHIVLTNGFQLQVFEYITTSPKKVLDFAVVDLEQHLETVLAVIGAEKMRNYFAGNDVLGEIGRGGFGRVFKSWQRRLKRIEALKVLHPSVESRSSMVKRFERGASGLAALKHPYICEIYEVGLYRGRPFYRLEFIDGIDVVNFVSGNALPVADRIKLFEEICEGIEHAHSRHLSHCDLTPANILVTHDGVPKIIDFDLCHIGQGASTLLSQVGATVAYMDRTIWSEPTNRDRLADIYSLGLVLWSMIAGKILSANWTPDDLRLGLIEADAEWLGNIIFRCVYLDREHRPQTVGELVGMFGITDWHSPVEALLQAAAGPMSPKNPKAAFELQFQLWKQGSGLPSNQDFIVGTLGLPENPANSEEKEFIFRCACAYWRRPLRTIFKEWPTTDMIDAAAKVVNDRTIDPSQLGAVAESHPARKALDILAVTDEYRSRPESELVARFYLDVIKGGQLKKMFFTILDDLARLQCFKKGKSPLRKEASERLIEMVKLRLGHANDGARKEIRKLMDKLSPEKCGDDSEAVANLAREIARDKKLEKYAIQLLGVMSNAAANDAFIEILEETKIADRKRFESILPWATGVSGTGSRKAVIEYLEDGSSIPDELRTVTRAILEKARTRQRGEKDL